MFKANEGSSMQFFLFPNIEWRRRTLTDKASSVELLVKLDYFCEGLKDLLKGE